MRKLCLAAIAIAMLFPGCKKEKSADKSGAGTPAGTATAGSTGAGSKAAGNKGAVNKAAAAPAKTAHMKLPKSGFSITVPEGSKVAEGIIAGSDSVKLPGTRATMIVRPGANKTLDAYVKWAKGHQVQKHLADVLKEGKDKQYTYIYKVDQMGTKKAVLIKTFEVGGKPYTCFANADSAAHAQQLKAACDTIKK